MVLCARFSPVLSVMLEGSRSFRRKYIQAFLLKGSYGLNIKVFCLGCCGLFWFFLCHPICY